VEGTHFSVEKNSEVTLTREGADVVSDYLAPMFKDKNLSQSELDVAKFIEANLNSFRVKGREIRLQKFVNTQIAQVMIGREKAQSLNRRQSRKFLTDRFEFDAQATQETPAKAPTETPKAEIRHLVTKKSQIKEEDIAIAKEYQSRGITGFDSDAEKVKAEAYFDIPNGNYPENFNMTTPDYSRLKNAQIDEVTAGVIHSSASRSGARNKAKWQPQPRGKSPLV
jgi:hypothetical protein